MGKRQALVMFGFAGFGMLAGVFATWLLDRRVEAGQGAAAGIADCLVRIGGRWICETLPDGVKSWIDLWLGQRNNQRIVLLALFDPVYQGVSNSMKAYLQEVAKRGDMEFLVKSEDSPDCR